MVSRKLMEIVIIPGALCIDIATTTFDIHRIHTGAPILLTFVLPLTLPNYLLFTQS